MDDTLEKFVLWDDEFVICSLSSVVFAFGASGIDLAIVNDESPACSFERAGHLDEFLRLC